jgi:ABC-type glycerol-3-phosphate transport system substrate-binding protein
MAQRLTRPGERTGVEPMIRSGIKNDVAARFVAWLYQNGGALFSDDGRKVGFATRETSDTIEWLKRLMERQGSPEPLDQTASRSAFFQGRASMFTEIDNFPAQIRADASGKTMDFGVGVMPVNDRNSRAKLSVPGRPGHGYSVMANATNAEGAWALAKYLVLGDAQCSFYTKAQGRISPLKRCNADPEVLKLPEIQTYAKYAGAIVAVPFTPGDADAVGVLETYAQRAINGQIGIDAAIQDAARDAQKALDDAWQAWTK